MDETFTGAAIPRFFKAGGGEVRRREERVVRWGSEVKQNETG